MALAFERFIRTRRDLGGLISAGGSGGTALATPAMRALPIGVPKVMVSSVASGDVRPYVGPADICMMYSVTDVQGINRISEQVLANAAHALAGMIAYRSARARQHQAGDRPDDVRRDHALRAAGDQAARGRVRLPGVPRHRHRRPVDGEARRLGPAGRRARHHDHRDLRRDWSAACCRQDPSAWTRSRAHACPTSARAARSTWSTSGPWDTVPAKFQGRNLYNHNPNVTLMRTTAEECAPIGALHRAQAQPHDRAGALRHPGRRRLRARCAGQGVLGSGGRPGAVHGDRERLPRRRRQTPARALPHNLNDPAFAELLVRLFREVVAAAPAPRRAMH